MLLLESSEKKVLSTSKVSEVITVEYIGSVEAPQKRLTTKHLKNVEIVGVQKLDTYPQCLEM